MTKKEPANLSGIRLVWGFLLLVLCIFLVLSFYSYDWRDISHLQAPPATPPSNLIGPVGAWLAYILFYLSGIGAFLIPIWCLVFGILMIFDRRENLWMKLLWCVLFMLATTCLLELHRDFWEATVDKINIPDAGGFLSRVLTHGILIKLLSKVGAGMFLWTALIAALAMFIGPANFVIAYGAILSFAATSSERASAYIAEHQDRRQLIEKEERVIDRRRAKLEKAIKKSPAPEKLKPKFRDAEPEPDDAPVASVAAAAKAPEPKKEKKSGRSLLSRMKAEKKPKKQPKPAPEPSPAPVISPDVDSGYQLPPMSLLETPDHGPDAGEAPDTATAGRVLEETLLEFDIEAKVVNAETGPVVTRYELLPAPGIRVERISALSNNIALAMKAASIRVQAPIPGKGVVGIEIPNSVAKKVFLREVLEGDVWTTGKAALPLVLGKDVGGNDLIADLATMPHILIAGATGAGKTVCMNSVLAGLLMAKRPDEMKLMLVDPKIVEFAAYNDLPHLVVPVITKAKKVSLGLRWAINEMEKRYKLFAKVGVRNIDSYNNREIATQDDMFAGKETPEGLPPEEQPKGPPRTVPYIVIVIDELADLMLADQAEIENCIARLAQLSRAVGIHMIISTQRPSVNVITGTIKANFPARVAFQVAQKVDSRTILDTSGAEKLLGRGDMLFLPPGSSKVFRAQGALTSDEDINRITDFIKQQATPDYVTEVQEQMEKKVVVGGLEGAEDDDMLAQAVEIIRETKRASTSSLQRRLRIGYTRAARIMDILEERGIIGPPRGSDPREILIDLDGEIPNNDPQEEVGE
jgi:S-DNA-T family DNA segregation ATPase FtsK/SpoIIIE